MRVDKFLWCVRYYKTRNMVTEACKKNHITVNGIIAKPSKEVFPTDRITFRKDQITQIIVVLDIPSNRVAAKLVDIYRKNGLPFLRYLKCKNFILKKFIPYIYLIIKDKKNSNYNYVNLKKHIVNNIFYPNIYIFGVFSFIKKIYQKLFKSY